jgi:transposase-like protein
MTTIDSITPSTPKQRRTRRRWTPQQRAEWVALFDKSGQSVLSFCRDHDLRAATLSLWRAQRRKWGEDGALVEIPVAALSAPSTHTAAVTMQLASGARLEIIAGTDPVWLGALVRALVSVSI